MLTVVLASDEAAPFLKEYDMLFQPFVQAGQLAFCRWNRQGRDFASAVPELRGVVRGHERWRALVVLPLPARREGADNAPEEEEWPSTWENPFDFLCNAGPDAGREIQESPVPLIRLAQMLGGVPEPVYRYSDEMVPAPPREGEKRPREYRDVVLRTDPEELQRQRRAWADLEEQYHFLCDKPAELWLLAARRIDPMRGREALPHDPAAPTPPRGRGFTLRNRYPARARFLTMDCAMPDHARSREDEFTFWMAVLTLALNDYEGGRLQPEQLYRLRARVDPEQMQQLFSRYCNRLQRIGRDVDHRAALLRARLEGSREQEELPEFGFKIPVEYRDERINGLTVDKPAVGLARDCPSDERVWWRDQMEISRRALARLLQAPRRALDGACVLTRRNARMDPRGLHQLDEYQLDELDALLQDEEIAIFCRDSAGALPVRRFRARRAAADQAVRTLMGRRMTRARALAAGFTALGVYLLGFVPELLRAARQDAGMDSLLAACGVRLGVLALAGILALLYFRRGLLNMIGDYNGVMNHIRARVAGSCQFFSDYLSQVCGYMRGRSILAALQGRSRLAREGLHQLEKHRRAIARCCGRTGDWMRDFGLDVLPDERLGQMEYFNSDIDPEENEAYDLRASREGFIEDREGKRLRVPYPFVRSLEIGREDLSQ